MAIKPAYERDLSPVEMVSTATGPMARVGCAQCGAHAEWRIATRVPPADIVRKHFAQSGWDVSRKLRCPACAKPRKEKAMTANVTPIKAEVEASEGAKRVKRMIYQALEDYYDDSKKSYRTGYSDKIIATEVGASEAFVKSIRETDFGPLAAPSEFSEIAAEVTKLASEIGRLQTRLQQISKANGWA